MKKVLIPNFWEACFPVTQAVNTTLLTYRGLFSVEFIKADTFKSKQKGNNQTKPHLQKTLRVEKASVRFTDIEA